MIINFKKITDTMKFKVDKVPEQSYLWKEFGRLSKKYIKMDLKRSPEIRCQLSPIEVIYKEQGKLTKLSRKKMIR